MVGTIVADSGIFRILRDEKVQKLPARLISSELSRIRAHGRHQPVSLRILRCTHAVEELPQGPEGTTA